MIPKPVDPQREHNNGLTYSRAKRLDLGLTERQNPWYDFVVMEAYLGEYLLEALGGSSYFSLAVEY
jgi:hypothetical protein